uniref:Uncharacterized protein n=1 Tax=Anopheles dirus TaxID=7168 RepID=A0A182N8D1_9DIPT
MTKRTLLKSIAQIYDPMWFLYPIKVKAKIFMQRLWKLKTGENKTWGWDTELPLQIQMSQEFTGIRNVARGNTIREHRIQQMQCREDVILKILSVTLCGGTDQIGFGDMK